MMTASSSAPPNAERNTRARRILAARLALFSACAVLFAALTGTAQTQPPAPAQAPAQTSATAPAPANNQPAEYVGSDTCQACHEDIGKAFQKNPHHLVETAKKYHFENQACESCHGPGSKHAESTSPADIKNPSKLRPSETDKICLNCHLNQSTTHVGRINGSHARNEVSCVACHSIHGSSAESLTPRRANTVNSQCAKCHADVWASFQRPHRHRLPEGAMSCVDCHNPHGGFFRGDVKTFRANEPGCLKCHGNLAGPFTFEHAPVRLEGCTTCHMPHGSSNPRMLVRSEVRFLCLECHSNLPVPTPAAGNPIGSVPPAFHDVRSPRFRECTVCHQKIHGSYADRSFRR